MTKRAFTGASVTDKIEFLIMTSGLTYKEFGVRMGYPEASASQAVYQLLQSKDPRLSTLRRFAAAVGCDVKDLI